MKQARCFHWYLIFPRDHDGAKNPRQNFNVLSKLYFTVLATTQPCNQSLSKYNSTYRQQEKCWMVFQSTYTVILVHMLYTFVQVFSSKTREKREIVPLVWRGKEFEQSCEQSVLSVRKDVSMPASDGDLSLKLLWIVSHLWPSNRKVADPRVIYSKNCFLKRRTTQVRFFVLENRVSNCFFLKKSRDFISTVWYKKNYPDWIFFGSEIAHWMSVCQKNNQTEAEF